jgi:tape measure domain-containing protein
LPQAIQRTSSINDPQLIESAKVKERDLSQLNLSQLVKAVYRSRGANKADNITQGMSVDELRAELSDYSPKQLGMLLSDSFRKEQGTKINESQAVARGHAQTLIDSGDLEGAARTLNTALQSLRSSRTNLSPQTYRGLETQIKSMMPRSLPSTSESAGVEDLVNASMGVEEFVTRVKSVLATTEGGVKSLSAVAQNAFTQLGGKGEYRNAFKVSALKPENGAHGSFDSNTKELRLKERSEFMKGDQFAVATFLHEVTHAIQAQKGDNHRPMQLTPEELIKLPAFAANSTSLDSGNMREIVKEMEAYAVELRSALGSNWMTQVADMPNKATPEIVKSYVTASQQGLGTISGAKSVSKSEGIKDSVVPKEKIDLSGLQNIIIEKIAPYKNLIETAFPDLGADISKLMSGGEVPNFLDNLGSAIGGIGLAALRTFGAIVVLKSFFEVSAGAIAANEAFMQLDRQIRSSTKGVQNLASIQAIAEKNNVSSNTLTRLVPATTLATQGTENASMAMPLALNIAKLSTAYGLDKEQSGRLTQAGQQVVGKGRLQAEEARGQIGELVPGFMPAVAAAKGVSVDQLDAQFKAGSINLVDFNRALVIAAQQAGGGVVTLGIESNKLSEKLDKMGAQSGQLVGPLAFQLTRFGNTLLDAVSVVSPIFSAVLPAGLLMSAGALALLAKAALSAALATARSVFGLMVVDSALKTLVAGIKTTAIQLGLMTAAISVVSGLFESLSSYQEGDDLLKKSRDAKSEPTKSKELSAVGLGSFTDMLLKPFTFLEDKIQGIKSDRDFIEKARAGKISGPFTGENSARSQGLDKILKAEEFTKSLADPLAGETRSIKAKVAPINTDLEAAQSALNIAKVKAGLDPSSKNLEARNAAAEKVSNLSAKRDEAIAPLISKKADIDQALGIVKKNLENNPVLAPELEPQIAALQKASKAAEESIKGLTSAITSNAEAQKAAYYRADLKLAKNTANQEQEQAKFDAQKTVARTAAGQLGGLDTSRANAETEVRSMQSAQDKASADLNAAMEGIQGTSSSLRDQVEAVLGKSIKNSSAQEIQIASNKLKEIDDSVDASKLAEYAQIRDDSINKITRANGDIANKQVELENSVYERNIAIAENLRDTSRKIEDQSIEFANASADLQESAKSLSLGAKLQSMNSTLKVASARAQAQFAGIADDFSGGVVNGILSWFDTMSQTLTGTLEQQLAKAQADADRRAHKNKLDSYNLQQQRMAEDSATEQAKFGGSSVSSGSTKFKGVQITSAVDATGEPGFDYVVGDGKKGAPVGSTTAGKVIEIKRNQKEIHKENGEQGRSAGNVVIVRSTDPKTGKEADLLYAHFDKIAVALGDVVKVGDILGTQGRTGSTTGAHVSLDFYGKDSYSTSAASENLRNQTLAGLQSGSLNKGVEDRAGAPMGMKSGSNGSADAFVGAVLSILEGGNRQDRVDVAQVISNRVGTNFDGYGNTIRDQAFAPNQFKPFFSASKGGYGIGKNEIQDRSSAIAALGKAGYSKSQANSALDEFFTDIKDKSQEAANFVQGRAFFKGTSEQGNMQSGDLIRSKDSNFFHYEGTNKPSRPVPIGQVFGSGSPGSGSYVPQTIQAKTLTDQGNYAAINEDLNAKLQTINDDATVAKYNAMRQQKEIELQTRKQYKQNTLDSDAAIVTGRLSKLKASTPQSDEIGQQKIAVEERALNNTLDRGKIEVELIDAKGGLEVIKQLRDFKKADPLATPEIMATIDDAIKAQEGRVSVLQSNLALVGADKNAFDEKQQLDKLLSDQKMKAAQINQELDQGVQNPFASQSQQLPQVESGMRFELAKKLEETRLDLQLQKQIALTRASQAAGKPITDLAEALSILGDSAKQGDEGAKGLLDLITALQRTLLVAPEQLKTNLSYKTKQANDADAGVRREGQSRVLNAVTGAMNDPYRDQAYYSPLKEQQLIIENQMQLAESLKWVDDNAGALGAEGVAQMREQLTALSKISLKNSIAQLDSVRLGLKNTFQNSFQSFFKDMQNPDLNIGDVFANLGQNILGGIVDQFATIASDRMSSMLAQSLPGGNLTNKAGQGMNGPTGNPGGKSSGVPGKGAAPMGGLASMGGGVGGDKGAASMGGGGGGMGGDKGAAPAMDPFSPAPIPVEVKNKEALGGGSGGGLGGLMSMMGGAEGGGMAGMMGGAGASGGAGAMSAGAAGGPWGMAAMAAITIGAGLISKSKNKKKQEPPDAMKDWKVAADWMPTAGYANWGDQYKTQVKDFSAQMMILNSATKQGVQAEMRQSEFKTNQSTQTPLFNQNVNIQASNLRSFKQSERQIASSTQNIGQQNFNRLG